eukprot:TRINITY_DN114992_c0_g1_i1.p1 TRINITY_DN114992_c0_g1~~TRINITY_DN114992_c0_g1_i1.p1  ORF type:complete len:582 (+),score=27.40 TRINITY_DN114992_c0_g1_i1:44-1789(+)
MNESYHTILPGQPGGSDDPMSPTTRATNPLVHMPPSADFTAAVNIPTRKEILLFNDHIKQHTTLHFHDGEMEHMYKRKLYHIKKCFLMLLLFQLAPVVLMAVVDLEPKKFFEDCQQDLIVRGGLVLGLLIAIIVTFFIQRCPCSVSGHIVMSILYIIIGAVQFYTVAQKLDCTVLDAGGAFFACTTWYLSIMVCMALNRILFTHRVIVVVVLCIILIVPVFLEEYRRDVDMSYYACWAGGTIMVMGFFLWAARAAEIDTRFAFFATEKSAQKVVHPKADNFRGERGSYEKYFGKHSCALIVGIDNHRSGESMYNADRLVREMYEFMQTHGIPAENIATLVGPCATRKNILAAVDNLSELANKWKSDGSECGAKRFWFYFTGHGFEKDGRGYVLPFDGNLLFPHSTCISMDLRDIVGPVLARQKFVVLDCSRSGLAVENHGGSQRGAHQWGVKKLKEMANNEASEILTSGTYGQMATDDERHGVLTAAFMSIVDETPPTMGHTTAQRVGDAVSSKVYRNTNGMQKPMHKHFIKPPKGETIFFPLSSNVDTAQFLGCNLGVGSSKDAPKDCPHVNDEETQKPW